MKEYSITFTAAEVLAILDGRKTQFRRIIKPQPVMSNSCGIPFFPDGYPVDYRQCPLGTDGDRLLVRGSYPKSIRITELLLLETESVRVERIRDITHHDALAEGCQPHPDCKHNARGDDFQRLWESINGPGSWAANPWVWVVEFRVVKGGQND